MTRPEQTCGFQVRNPEGTFDCEILKIMATADPRYHNKVVRPRTEAGIRVNLCQEGFMQADCSEGKEDFATRLRRDSQPSNPIVRIVR